MDTALANALCCLRRGHVTAARQWFRLSRAYRAGLIPN